MGLKSALIVAHVPQWPAIGRENGFVWPNLFRFGFPPRRSKKSSNGAGPSPFGVVHYSPSERPEKERASLLPEALRRHARGGANSLALDGGISASSERIAA